MNNDYESIAKMFKVLGDSNRVKILDILSCGEKCTCDLLESFEFTQPTLSHHIKVLTECGLVLSRKEGIWNYYKLNITNANRLILNLMNIFTDTEKCICKQKECACKSNK